MATAIARAPAPDGTAAQLVLAGQVHEDGRRERPGEVPDVDEHPDRQHSRGRDAACGPRHDEQVVAGEELRARNDDQDQPEGEGQAREQARDAERQLPGARGHRRGENRAERDERAREHGEDEQPLRAQGGLGDPGLLGPSGHGRRRQRVEASRGKARRALAARVHSPSFAARALEPPPARPPICHHSGVWKLFLFAWLSNIVALFVAAWIVSGVDYGDDFWVLFLAALVFTTVNWFVRPLVILLDSLGGIWLKNEWYTGLRRRVMQVISITGVWPPGLI